jgi:hypothetical protein
VALVVVLALLAYPLSVGPAEWMRAHGWLSQGTLEALDWFYSPLPWIYGASPALIRRAIDWYVSLWR